MPQDSQSGQGPPGGSLGSGEWQEAGGGQAGPGTYTLPAQTLSSGERWSLAFPGTNFYHEQMTAD